VGSKKKFTDAERLEKKETHYQLVQKPRLVSEWNRLAPYRYEDGWKGKYSVAEKVAFQNHIREVNRERFQNILEDDSAWERVNRTDDGWHQKKWRKERKNRIGEYITDAEVMRWNDIIYGGKIEDGEEEDKGFQNPYVD